MIRVLHLLEKSADYQTAMAVSQLSRAKNENLAWETRTIGRGGNYRGITHAILFLRRFGVAADLIHAWDETALTVAALGTGGRIVYSPSTFPTRRSILWLRSAMDYRDIQVICPTETMRRRFVEQGVPISRCHLIRPGVEFARIGRRPNAVLRTKLGFAADDSVMLAVGESTRPADHARAVWTAVILHVLDSRNRLLIWGKGPMAERTRRFAEHLKTPELLRVATDHLGPSAEFDELLPAADVALVTATAPVAPLPIAQCMAAGLPIVSLAGSTIAELLEDRHNALLVGDPAPRQIARRVLDLREDAKLQWSLCDTARTEAYEYFSMTRFVQQFQDMYEQFDTGKSVQIVQPAPGTGSRFHGIA